MGRESWNINGGRFQLIAVMMLVLLVGDVVGGILVILDRPCIYGSRVDD